MKKIYHFTPEMDQQILELYRGGVGRGQVKQLAAKYRFPVNVVSNRAHTLLEAIGAESVSRKNQAFVKATAPSAAIEQLLFARRMSSFLFRNQAVDNPV